MTSRHKLLPVLLGLGVVLTNAPLAALAQQGPGAAIRLSPQQQEQLFPEQKQLWLKRNQARIAALQAGQRCVQASRNAEAFRTCRKQERQTNMRLRRAHMADMRALLARFGVQLPPPPERRGAQREEAAGGWKNGSGGGSAGAEI